MTQHKFIEKYYPRLSPVEMIFFLWWQDRFYLPKTSHQIAGKWWGSKRSVQRYISALKKEDLVAEFSGYHYLPKPIFR